MPSVIHQCYVSNIAGKWDQTNRVVLSKIFIVSDFIEIQKATVWTSLFFLHQSCPVNCVVLGISPEPSPLASKVWNMLH